MSEGNLRTLAHGDGAVTYAYDALGRQVGRGNGGPATYYYYDGDEVIAELSGTTWTQSTWGPNNQVRRAQEFTFYDGLGSAMGETNGYENTTEWINFDAFGRQIGIEGSSADPFQYKSEYGYRSDGDGAVADQQIIKVGARYYDPVLGRFISRDSDLAQSPYSYCNGDPLNDEDPSGRAGEVSVSLGWFAQYFMPGVGADVSFNIGADGLGFTIDGWAGSGLGAGAGAGPGVTVSNGDASDGGPGFFAGGMGYFGFDTGASFGGGVSGSGSGLSEYLSVGPPIFGVIGGAGVIGQVGASESIGWSWGQVGSAIVSGIKSIF